MWFIVNELGFRLLKSLLANEKNRSRHDLLRLSVSWLFFVRFQTCHSPFILYFWDLSVSLSVCPCVLPGFSWVFLHEKAYQVTDTGIESSVMTKVKGFGKLNGRTVDVADFVVPTQVQVLP